MANMLVHLSPDEKAWLDGFKVTRKIIGPSSTDWIYRNVPTEQCAITWKVVLNDATNFKKIVVDSLFNGHDVDYIVYGTEGRLSQCSVRVVYDVGHLKLEVVNTSSSPVTANLITLNSMTL